MSFADFAQAPKGGYVKDWHFRAAFPVDAAKMVPTPPLFQDDWLNGYARRHACSHGAAVEVNDNYRSSDYEFVYVGGAGTATHLHTDVVSDGVFGVVEKCLILHVKLVHFSVNFTY
jgi:hypothetical protein